MRGLSFIGLLVGLGVVGVLVFNQLKPSPETGETLPTEAIEKANEASEVMEQQNDTLKALDQQVEQLEQSEPNLPED